jgi:hypothetical protein
MPVDPKGRKPRLQTFRERPHLCAEALRPPARSLLGVGRVRRHKGLHYNSFRTELFRNVKIEIAISLIRMLVGRTL